MGAEGGKGAKLKKASPFVGAPRERRVTGLWTRGAGARLGGGGGGEVGSPGEKRRNKRRGKTDARG